MKDIARWCSEEGGWPSSGAEAARTGVPGSTDNSFRRRRRGVAGATGVTGARRAAGHHQHNQHTTEPRTAPVASGSSSIDGGIGSNAKVEPKAHIFVGGAIITTGFSSGG